MRKLVACFILSDHGNQVKTSPDGRKEGNGRTEGRRFVVRQRMK